MNELFFYKSPFMLAFRDQPAFVQGHLPYLDAYSASLCRLGRVISILLLFKFRGDNSWRHWKRLSYTNID